MRKEGVRMVTLLKNLLAEERGQDTLEYVFIGLVVALGAVAGMTSLAASINAEFGKLGTDLT
jgi:Flp pilus assembly pilin Flp